MKSFAIIAGLFAAVALAAPVKPVSDLDSFNYTNNINNAVAVEDATSDEFNYHNNIDNAVTAEDAVSDEFNYHNNIDNAVTVVDSDGKENYESQISP